MRVDGWMDGQGVRVFRGESTARRREEDGGEEVEGGRGRGRKKRERETQRCLWARFDGQDRTGGPRPPELFCLSGLRFFCRE